MLIMRLKEMMVYLSNCLIFGNELDHVDYGFEYVVIVR